MGSDLSEEKALGQPEKITWKSILTLRNIS